MPRTTYELELQTMVTGEVSIHEPRPGKFLAICLTGDCKWDSGILYGELHAVESIAGTHLRVHHN